jgi:hypothetical protein
MGLKLAPSVTVGLEEDECLQLDHMIEEQRLVEVRRCQLELVVAGL